MVAAALLALAAASGGAAATPQPDPHIVFNDGEPNVVIRRDFTADGVEFSAKLKDGWSFSVNVDGDQNGIWGKGPEREGLGIGPTPDRRFGPTSHGALCAQYVLTSDPQDPGDIYSSSICGALASKATIEAGAADTDDQALIRLKIPYDELFGNRPNAHLQICLWDAHQRTCQHSPAEPLILTRPPSAMPAPKN